MNNIIQDTFIAAMSSLGLTKKGNSWYLRSDETILVIELQKSNYSLRYFVNIAVWLLPLGMTKFPKEQACHIRTRLSQLVPESDRLDTLLDIDQAISDPERKRELGLLLTDTIGWVVDASALIEALRSERGIFLQSQSLVTGLAQRLLN